MLRSGFDCEVYTVHVLTNEVATTVQRQGRVMDRIMLGSASGQHIRAGGAWSTRRPLALRAPHQRVGVDTAARAAAARLRLVERGEDVRELLLHLQRVLLEIVLKLLEVLL